MAHLMATGRQPIVMNMVAVMHSDKSTRAICLHGWVQTSCTPMNVTTSFLPAFMQGLILSLELIDRIAALMPPPRTHRHRYFGVLAPNYEVDQRISW